jgi:hypothetical protein
MTELIQRRSNWPRNLISNGPTGTASNSVLSAVGTIVWWATIGLFPHRHRVCRQNRRSGSFVFLFHAACVSVESVPEQSVHVPPFCLTFQFFLSLCPPDPVTPIL